MPRPRNVINQILPERLALARTAKGLTQKEFAHLLDATEVSDKSTISPTNVSLWETSHRSIPSAYNNTIADILGVTVAYLQGKTSTPTKETPDEHDNTTTPHTEIPYDNLYYYDGQPIFVEFMNLKKEPAWGIYDRRHNRIVFKDMIFSLDTNSKYEIKLYVVAPEYITQYNQYYRKRMTRKKMMASESVYIILNSYDPVIRSRYEGWYSHNETRTNLINAYGLTLPYEGLNISYFAYEDSMENSL